MKSTHEDWYKSCRIVQSGFNYVHASTTECSWVITFVMKTVNMAIQKFPNVRYSLYPPWMHHSMNGIEMGNSKMGYQNRHGCIKHWALGHRVVTNYEVSICPTMTQQNLNTRSTN